MSKVCRFTQHLLCAVVSSLVSHTLISSKLHMKTKLVDTLIADNIRNKRLLSISLLKSTYNVSI